MTKRKMFNLHDRVLKDKLDSSRGAMDTMRKLSFRIKQLANQMPEGVAARGRYSHYSKQSHVSQPT